MGTYRSHSTGHLPRVNESDRLPPATAGNEEAVMARTAAQKKPADTDVLSLKVTLRDIRPPIWRRILVPRDMTLADLHRAIQAVMGWEDAHLHAFNVGGRQYSARGMLPDATNEARVTLNSLAKSGTTASAIPTISATTGSMTS